MINNFDYMNSMYSNNTNAMYNGTYNLNSSCGSMPYYGYCPYLNYYRGTSYYGGTCPYSDNFYQYSPAVNCINNNYRQDLEATAAQSTNFNGEIRMRTVSVEDIKD